MSISVENLQNILSMYDSESYNKSLTNSYFAKSGDIIYDDSIDLNKDGIVTFDEFAQYCSENNVSKTETNQMLKIQKGLKAIEILNNAQKTNTSQTLFGYQNANQIDSNSDGTISYQEYIEYHLKYIQQTSQKNQSNLLGYTSNNTETIYGLIDIFI